MDSSSQEGEEMSKITKVKTFAVPFPLRESKGNLTVNTNTPSKPSKEQIINQAFKFHSQGNILEATKYYQYFINEGFKDHRVFSNYGIILQDLGSLKEAELSCRKAIEINPYFAEAHSNLGIILRDLGKLQEAELSCRKAIEINPYYAEAHSNLGNVLIDLGKLQEAEISYRKAIKIKPNYAKGYYNLGGILRDYGEFQDAELSTRKAIEINPNFAEAHSNLGIILKDLGKLQEAELSTRKAIEINPDFTEAYYSLSLLKFSDENNKWQNQLFSKSILNNKSQKDQVKIYLARANICHKEKHYKASAKYLILANNLKLILQPSIADHLINQSKVLLIESDKQEINQQEYAKSPESIFIVGMPRSGSTLLESIISMNYIVDDLGETDILMETFLDNKKGDQVLTLAEGYWNKIKDLKKQSNITTNKNLYNYQYAGIIAKQIPNAKIIHCFRDPLDNILSIYRTHFAKGNEYSSSLVDCARVYLNQDEVMTKYKNRFRSKIYDLNYESLVRNPDQVIKSLIAWLGWKWNDSYLSPHLNERSVSTASNVQVRSPINSKSIGGWKNYKEMLKPAIGILTQTDKYRDITS
ncbi:sulfotransferase family protein [Prochlorococcus marinus]|uniref:sulfotransferase family protein n=1 Tax=Prochlorococcus marinus TaxID=1219 RepID=UPI0022B4CED2|nr:sulfotransferase family protein [Prochlorococcus marinus]